MPVDPQPEAKFRDSAAPAPLHDGPVPELWKVVARFDYRKINPYQAFRNAVGVALPLIVGYALHMPRGGLVVASGALNVSYSDGSDPYRRRASRMLASSVFCAIAVLAGSLSGHHVILNTILVVIWAFLTGMFVAFGGSAPDIGVISLVTMLIYSAQTLSPREAFLSSGLALGGGLFQTLLSILLWPVRRYEPERRALADFYLDLASVTEVPLTATAAPPASMRSSAAQEALLDIGRDTGIESMRYRALLSQAERIRLALLMLSRLRIRMVREDPEHALIKLLDEYLEKVSEALNWVGRSLQTGKLAGISQQEFDAMVSLRKEFRGLVDRESGSFFGAAASDARYQIDALAGQVRAAIDLAANMTSTGATAFVKRDAAQPWRTRFSSRSATFRANLNFDSSAFRHAIRLAAVVAVANVLEHGFSWRRSYWLPMTVVLVLKPEFATTFSRGFLRIAGTVAGLLLSTALFHFIPNSVALQIILIFGFTFFLRWLGPANYGLFAIFVSALIVLLIAITGIAPRDVIWARGANTGAGGLLALLGYWLWPTWESAHVPERIAQLLDAYRAYFHRLAAAYQKQESTSDRELDGLRYSARMARSNLEGSIALLATEPGTTQAQLSRLYAILASTHRFVHAAMALDAGWSQTPTGPPRTPFLQFAGAVEDTFLLLAKSVRGGKVHAGEYPDLREAYTRLQSTGDASISRYALVNIEGDRITNSLNTLREQIRSSRAVAEEGPAGAEIRPDPPVAKQPV